MNIRGAMARLAPSGLVSWLGRLQFQIPMLAPLINWAGSGARHGESVMRHGVGKGLKFDPRGGNPGYALGTSDLLEQQVLAQHLKPGDVFYDIGANVGFFTTLAGRLVGPRGNVYGFEPFPESASTAVANAKRNGFEHIQILQVAVSSIEGNGAFSTKGSTVNFRLLTPGENAPDGGQVLHVRVRTIDGMVSCGEVKPPTLVMIDVEGGELEVLRGMRQTILRHLPTIVCEVHWIPGPRFLAELGEIFAEGFWSVKCLNYPSVPSTAERYHVLLAPSAVSSARPSAAAEQKIP